MTLPQIIKALRPVKRVSDRQVRRYLAQFDIRHVGIRQRPQQYPEDSAERIALALGFRNGGGK